MPSPVDNLNPDNITHEANELVRSGARLNVAEACRERMVGVDKEALLRTALNRAYYAALLSVRQRIEHAQGSRAVPRSRSHAAILGALRAGGGDFVRIHDSLQRLRARREAADYELRSKPLIESKVQTEIERSRALIRTRIKAVPDAEFRRLAISSN